MAAISCLYEDTEIQIFVSMSLMIITKVYFELLENCDWNVWLKKHLICYCTLLEMLLIQIEKFRMKLSHLWVFKLRKQLFRLLLKTSIFQLWLIKPLMSANLSNLVYLYVLQKAVFFIKGFLVQFQFFPLLMKLLLLLYLRYCVNLSALYTNCSNHVLNFSAIGSVSEMTFISNALSVIGDVCVFLTRSPNQI